MSTLTPARTELIPLLDPHLFPFKPKLNEKSSEMAQNFLSDFSTDRQLKHVKRLQEFKEIAASNYRNWYCQDKRQKNAIEKEKMVSADESSATTANDSLTTSAKETNPSSDKLAQLIRIYRQPIPRRLGVPPGLVRSRAMAHSAPRAAPPPPPITAPLPEPVPPATAAPSVRARPPRRMSPIVIRSKSQTRVTRREESPPKVLRRPESPPRRLVLNDSINIERLKLARDEAERAMKEHKIFTIYGPYPALREALRRRGWIEKFDRGELFPSLHGSKKSTKRNNKSDDDDDDDNDDELGDDDLEEGALDEDENYIPPWEENEGYYGLLSRLVKSALPDLIWSVRASYDANTLNKDQMVNHYARNGCFTTKVGLCSSLKNLPWFHSGCAEEFYPRCYKVTHEDDKVAFIDDYRLTSCISFVKLAQNRCRGIIEPDMNSILAMSSDDRKESVSNSEEDLLNSGNPAGASTRKVPASWLEFALNKVEQYTLARDHEDIDISIHLHNETTDEQWTQFIDQFYAASHAYAEIENMHAYLAKIDECLKNVEQHWPQYHIDGTRNIWILKPGAKSRGRGIVVYDRLDQILKLCSSTLINDRKFVVQKYLERPLLIHNTKFDIRQWFLVTDWNPLTIWIYKDCYLRFCTQHFSLATTQQNVHLCNYSIQKHYKNNSNRHADLPVENMWTSEEFIEKYLRPNQLAEKWESCIYPEMKEAIVCSMLVAQDTIDPRRNSFELFGADFMLGEDLKPWLIEINCSPTMARCTAVTTEMCDSVLEDTCKVIIDRKYNRTNDTGRFELIHKGTPVPVPIYVGIDLRIEGKSCKTGRTAHVHAPKISAPVSAPPHASNSKSELDHSSSALDNRQSADLVEASSADSLLEKDEQPQYHFHPTTTIATKAKTRAKAKQLHRTKTAGQISTSKGNQPIPKINVAELLFKQPELRGSTNSVPLIRRLHQSWLTQKIKDQQSEKTNLKLLSPSKTTLTTTNSLSVTLTPIETENETLPVITVV